MPFDSVTFVMDDIAPTAWGNVDCADRDGFAEVQVAKRE